jgi:hypothetical protein
MIGINYFYNWCNYSSTNTTPINYGDTKMSLSQVVAATTSGTLYDAVPPNAAGSNAGGNGGSVARASDSSLLDGVSVSRYDAGVFGSTVINNNDADKAVDAQPFAKNNQSPIAKVLTSSPASEPSLVQSIHKIQVLGMGYAEGVRTRLQTTAIREGYWNEYTGQFDPGYPVVTVDVFGTDSAANPTRSVPGRLSFAGQSATTTTNYSEKTG